MWSIPRRRTGAGGGATKASHLEDALAAEQLQLSEDELRRLEEPYVPHLIAGH